MEEEEQAAERPPRTKLCKQCGKELSVDRFVCPDCGYVYPWFKLRLYAGGCGVLFFIFAMVIYALASMVPPPELPEPPADGATEQME